MSKKKARAKRAKDNPHGLNDRQRLFAERYAIHRNGAKAAIEADYSEKTAAAAASRLLTNEKVKAYVDELVNSATEAAALDSTRIIEEFARIAFSDIRDAVKWGSDPLTEFLIEQGVLDVDDPERAEQFSGLASSGVYPVSLVPSNEISDDIAAAIGEVSLTRQGVKIKMHSKLDALDKLARIKKLYKSDEDAAAAGAVLDLVMQARQRAGIA